jgi:hypothetical protein
VTKIDGVDIHFIHVKSRHESAMPLIMTHGWPGSVTRGAYAHFDRGVYCSMQSGRI